MQDLLEWFESNLPFEHTDISPAIVVVGVSMDMSLMDYAWDVLPRFSF